MNSNFFGFIFATLTYALLLLITLIFIGVLIISRDLPDYKGFSNYQSPSITRIYTSDGYVLDDSVIQNRVFIQIDQVPEFVINAFISAEDKDFFKHTGVDYKSLLNAIYVNIKNIIIGNDRLIGASTITQQVAKNFFLNNERTLVRKFKEFIISYKIEQSLTKREILELYLNEIYFGMGCYGIASASINYFDKSLDELNIEEVAYLAALPKAPNNYHPVNNKEKAIARRNWVIDKMSDNGYILKTEAHELKNFPLLTNVNSIKIEKYNANYFLDEVKESLDTIFNKKIEYRNGLTIKTSLDTIIHKNSRDSFKNTLINFDRTMGWSGPVLNINTDKSDWLNIFDNLMLKPLSTDSYVAIVQDISDKEITFKLHKNHIQYKRDDKIISILKEELAWIKIINNKNLLKKNYLSLGDVVHLSNFKDKAGWNIYQVPELDGAMVVMDPNTGRVLSMIGGYDYNLDRFNRATKAYKKTGSIIQPFVYLNALENGYKPNSLILDAPLIKKIDDLEKIQYKNYNNIYNGPSTLRFGLETSSNVMVIRLMEFLGFPAVHRTFIDFGIYEEQSPPNSLGSIETTLLRLTNAFSSFANGGKLITPTYIDKIQNKYGKTIYKVDKADCIGCNVNAHGDSGIPFIIDNRVNLIEEKIAYQITSMLEGAIKFDANKNIDLLEFPVAGKRGMSDEYTESWFVGYTPDVIVGIYLSYDYPGKVMNNFNENDLTEFIFKEFIQNFSDTNIMKNFDIPEGLTLIEINKKTGKQFNLIPGETILESFVK